MTTLVTESRAGQPPRPCPEALRVALFGCDGSVLWHILQPQPTGLWEFFRMRFFIMFSRLLLYLSQTTGKLELRKEKVLATVKSPNSPEPSTVSSHKTFLFRSSLIHHEKDITEKLRYGCTS